MANILPPRPGPSAQLRQFAIVASQFNRRYVDGLVAHAQREFDAIAPGSMVELYEVPGAFEIPLVVQMLAQRGGVDAILALGVVIEGETAHARLIASVITEKLSDLGLRHRLPVVHEVLLLENEEQARRRCLEEEINRGTEAARVAVRMAEVMDTFSLPASP